MASFAVNIDDSLLKTFTWLETSGNLDNIAPKMLKAGGEILVNACRSKAPRSSRNHKHIADHIVLNTPKKAKNGSAWVSTITVNGKREDGVRLMEAAACAEFGSSKTPPSPFFKPATEQCRGRVNEEMKRVFDEEFKKNL